MKDKYRLFEIILYKESESYNSDEVIKNLKGYRKYAYCLHDQDINDKGEYKKAHYHIILNLDNACYSSGIAKKLGVPENFVNHIRNERSYVRYLIHFDDPEKAQYSFNSIKKSREYERFINKCFDDKETEDEIINNIFAFLVSSCERNRSKSQVLYELINYVNLNCYDTIYKRYRNEFQEFINLNIS